MNVDLPREKQQRLRSAAFPADRAGMSLVEVLAALALLGIVSGMGGAALGQQSILAERIAAARKRLVEGEALRAAVEAALAADARLPQGSRCRREPAFTAPLRYGKRFIAGFDCELGVSGSSDRRHILAAAAVR